MEFCGLRLASDEDEEIKMRLRAAGLFERVDGGVCHYHTAVLDYSFVTFDGFIDRQE